MLAENVLEVANFLQSRRAFTNLNIADLVTGSSGPDI